VWGWLAEATGGLAAPIVCHLVWDVLLLFVAPVVAGSV
jgi:membrane protease YdiL (CAAX protease family)